MTTTGSYSDRGRFGWLLRARLSGLAPFAVISAVLAVFLLPVVYFTAMNSNGAFSYGAATSVEDMVRWMSRQFENGVFLESAVSGVAHVLYMLLALVLALTANGYLHNKSMTDLYHSLPVSRPHLLTANLLAGCGIALLPLYAVTLIMLPVQLIGFSSYGIFGAQYFTNTILDILSITVAVLMVYLFVTLIAANTGTGFDAFAVAMALGFAPILIYLTCNVVFDRHVYGAYMNIEEHVLLLSPFTFPMHRFMIYAEPLLRRAVHLAAGTGICVVLYLLSVFFYGRRKSELAEQTRGQDALQTIVKCIGAYCGGALFYMIFEPRHAASTVIYTLLGSVMTGVIAEIIMSRGVRFLLKNTAWILGAGAVTSVLFLAIMYDWAGYSRYVPAPEQVKSVEISYNGRFDALGADRYYGHGYEEAQAALTDPESIRIVTDSHRQAVDRWQNKNGDDSFSYQYITLRYTLASGREVNRRFSEYAFEAMLALSDLENKPDFIRAKHPLFRESLWQERSDRAVTVKLYNGMRSESQELALNKAERDALLEALRTDMLSESLQEIKNPTAPALGWVELSVSEPAYTDPNSLYSYDNEKRLISTSSVLLTHEYKNALALLGDWGYGSLTTGARESFDGVALYYRPYYYSRYYGSSPDRVTLLREDVLSEFQENVLTGLPEGESGQQWAVSDKEIAIMAEENRDSAGKLLRIEDESLYDGLLRSSQDQLLLTQKELESGEVLYAVFQKEGKTVGVKFIRRDRLPPQLQKEFMQQG